MADGGPGRMGIAPTRLTIQPMPGECLQSVAVRYANATRVEVPALLVNGLAMQRNGLASLPFTSPAIEKLAYLASIEPSKLMEAAAFHEDDGIALGGVAVPSWVVDVSSRAVAPGILRADGTDPWVRRTWQFRCLPCDPETGEAVRRSCDCGRALMWLGCSSIAHCSHCGRDLGEIPPEYLSGDMVAATRTLAGIVAGKPSSIEWPTSLFPSLTPALMLSFCALIGALEYRISGIDGIGPSAFMAVSGMRSLQRGPDCLEEIIRAFAMAHERNDPGHGSALAAIELLHIFRPLGPAVERLIRSRISKVLRA